MNEITPKPGNISIIILILFIILLIMFSVEVLFITMDWELRRMYHGDVTTSLRLHFLVVLLLL